VTHYQRGAAFERAVAARLADDGYLVMRAAGSHGVADLVAIKPGQVVLIQCKISGIISIADWNLFYETASRAGALPVLAYKPRRGVYAYHVLCGVRQARVVAPFRPWTPDSLSDDLPGSPRSPKRVDEVLTATNGE
jgi:Holliday junction resolvase